MKKIRLVFPLLLLATATFFFACGGGDKKADNDGDKTEVNANQGPEYTSAYICPMHCKGSGSDKAGICPTCEMDYVANDNYQTPEPEPGQDSDYGHDIGNDHDHDHDHDHEGHNH